MGLKQKIKSKATDEVCMYEPAQQYVVLPEKYVKLTEVLAEISLVKEKIRERLVEVSSKFAEATDNDVDDFLYGEDDKGDIFNVGGLGGKQSAFKEVLALLNGEKEEKE